MDLIAYNLLPTTSKETGGEGGFVWPGRGSVAVGIRREV